MRLSVLRPPSAHEILTRRIHELLRDYPELVSLVRDLGVDPGDEGADVLGTRMDADSPWVARIMDEVRWREVGNGEGASGEE